MPGIISLGRNRKTVITDGGPAKAGNGPIPDGILRSFLNRSGFSIIETTIVSAVLLASLFSFFQMANHFSLWWSRQEDHYEKTAAARYVIGKVTDLLFMAGYQPSITGLPSIGNNSFSVEFLVDDADEAEDRYTRHRLYSVYQEGDLVKLKTQRRLLPLDGSPSWGRGSTTVLADGVKELSFKYYDSSGNETEVPGLVRLVTFTLRIKAPSLPGNPSPGEHCYRSAVQLRNHHG